jgi:hypothetical protein
MDASVANRNNLRPVSGFRGARAEVCVERIRMETAQGRSLKLHGILVDGMIERIEGSPQDADAEIKKRREAGHTSAYLFAAQSEQEFERKKQGEIVDCRPSCSRSRGAGRCEKIDRNSRRPFSQGSEMYPPPSRIALRPSNRQRFSLACGALVNNRFFHIFQSLFCSESSNYEQTESFP